MNLDCSTGLEVIRQAFEKQSEDRLFAEWNIEHVLEAFGNKGKFTPWEEYRDKSFGKISVPKTPKLSAQEIIAKAEKIKAKDRKRG